MRSRILVISLLFLSLGTYAQIDGLSYQAVIIDPNPKEIPGVDIQGNILPNAEVSIRFTIINQNNEEEYQEVQQTTTDAFGMINVIIGQGQSTGTGVPEFTLIDWDGTPKDLRVEIDFEGTASSFSDLSRQQLTFIPYAFHRNVTATGDLDVDGTTDLNGILTVQGPTDLNNSLDVTNGNPTRLSGSLSVDSSTTLNEQLTVAGSTTLNDSLVVANQKPSNFTGDITVGGLSSFNGPTAFNAPAEFVEIGVNGPSDLRGQVHVRANMDTIGNQMQYQAYPLLVEGSKQGIAIKVNENRSIRNNYVSFWDGEDMWGRIEGITLDELDEDTEYISELAIRSTDVIINGVDAFIAVAENAQGVIKLSAAGSSSTACAGVGACVTAPIPSLIVESSSNLVLKIANVVSVGGNLALSIAEEASFIGFTRDNIGVSYQSGSGDYAEWLPKENSGETFEAGEIVGIRNGKVTKNTWEVDKVMVVSTRPIVLGNMPPQSQEDQYVKIAFMGQVPVKVVGSVKPGDYILPSEVGSGFGKAIAPESMHVSDYRKIAGVVWEVKASIGSNVHLVNAAVGINTNDLTRVIEKQEKEMLALRQEYDALKKQVESSNLVLAELVPGYAEALQKNEGIIISHPANKEEIKDHDAAVEEHYITSHHSEDIIYFTLSQHQVEASIDLAREQYISMLRDAETMDLLMGTTDMEISTMKEKMNLIAYDQHPFWQKIDSDPGYKKEIIQYIQHQFEKAIHTHRKYAHKFSEMEVVD